MINSIQVAKQITFTGAVMKNEDTIVGALQAFAAC